MIAKQTTATRSHLTRTPSLRENANMPLSQSRLPRDTPSPRRWPPRVTAYSNYQLRQRRWLRQRTVPNGEVADAFLGVHGLNRRKGICKSQDDLLDELADVIITAAVAMNGITGDAELARRHFEQRLAAVTARASL
jgi:hypothetical protein